MKAARAGSALGFFLLVPGFFLLVLGAKLWLIGAFGSPIPYWDQWGHEAQRMYKPFVEGRWHPLDVFERANVHHLAWSRALGVSLLAANGLQWDPRVQMIVQGTLHAAFVTILAFAVAARLGRGALAVSLAVLGLYLVFPFGYGNTLWGYESHFYFLVFWSVLAILGLAPRTPREPGWWLGLGAAVFALFSAASGFLAGAASAAAALGLGVTRRRQWRSVAPTIAAGLALVALGAWMTQYEGTMEGNRFQNLRSEEAASGPARVATMLVAAGQCLGWPLPRPGLAGWLLYAPLAVFLALWLREGLRRGSDVPAERRAETLLVALGAWTFLQAIGISALRGGEVATRHRDVLIFGVWANALALLALLRGRLAPGARRIAAGGAALWIAAVGVGFALTARHTWREELPEWRSQAREQLVHVQDFLATDDPAHLLDKPLFAIPHPRPELLIALLRDPAVRSVLPPVIRDPLPLAPLADGGGWRVGPDRTALAPPAPGVPYWVSAPGSVPRFRSEPIITRASALDLAVAGAGLPPDTAAEIRLVDAANDAPLRWVRVPRLEGAWVPVEIAVPRGGRPFRLEIAAAPGAPPDAWLAVAAPKEVGPLGRLLVPLTDPRAAGALVLAGLALLALGALALVGFARPALSARAHRSS